MFFTLLAQAAQTSTEIDGTTIATIGGGSLLVIVNTIIIPWIIRLQNKMDAMSDELAKKTTRADVTEEVKQVVSSHCAIERAKLIANASDSAASIAVLTRQSEDNATKLNNLDMAMQALSTNLSVIAARLPSLIETNELLRAVKQELKKREGGSK